MTWSTTTTTPTVGAMVLDTGTKKRSAFPKAISQEPNFSRLFPGFFLSFLEQRDQKTVDLSRYRQSGASCLISFQTRPGTQTSTTKFRCISTICQSANCVETLESKSTQLIQIQSRKDSLHCPDLNPRPPWYLADALPIELLSYPGYIQRL